MAIEKMIMVNIVGHMDDIDKVSRAVVLSKAFQPVNALQEINTTDFTLSPTENNMEALMDVCYIRPYSDERDYTDINKKMNKLRSMCNSSKRYILKQDEVSLSFEEICNKLDELYDKFIKIDNELSEKIELKNKIETYIKNLSNLREVDIPIHEIKSLKNFSFEIFNVPKESMIKLRENYENIPAIVIRVSKNVEYETIMAFTPNALKMETDKIFKSLNCELVKVPGKYEGTPTEVISQLNNKLKELKDEINELNKQNHKLSKKYKREVYVIEKNIEIETKAAEVKNEMGCTNEFFYLCGWVPKSLLSNFRASMSDIEEKLIIIEKNSDEIENTNIIPPTKLKNNFLVKPFETMIGMYGVPSYNEIDPTTFFGITYMIMFGAMFGDLGQGLVFFLAGLFLKYKKKRINLGGILARLGISSSIFGVLYGSVFGFENIIPALFIRPMENISDILLYAIVFGCGLLILGFVYSLINNFKKRDIQNGFFGNNGLAGMLFYLSALLFVYTKLKNIEIMSGNAWAIIFIVLLVVILLKEPLANLLQNKRPLFTESKNDYFVENGFGIAETILSLFSNTLSFIRVGAFALNHVGLFIAFAALANMMKSGAMSVTMYILGNIIILGLEGLIVFIQGLRLEYYELFSKYYDGGGIPFNPVKISDNVVLDIEKNY